MCESLCNLQHVHMCMSLVLCVQFMIPEINRVVVLLEYLVELHVLLLLYSLYFDITQKVCPAVQIQYCILMHKKFIPKTAKLPIPQKFLP